MRLQCYEGLDEAKAMYEWNYRKQLLRIQAGGEGGWDDVQEDIFSYRVPADPAADAGDLQPRAGRSC